MGWISDARPSPAIVIAVLALIAALTGTAVAGPDASSSAVNKKKVKKIARKQANKQINARLPFGTDDIADGAVSRPKLADGAVSGAKVADRSLGTAKVARSIPAVRVTHSVNQIITQGPDATLRFDSERYDSANMHSNATNNSRLTAPVTGIYEIGANVEWDVNSAGRRRLAVLKNGTTFIAFEQIPPVSNETTGQELTTQARLRAGDFVQAQVLQNSGGSLNVLKLNEYSPEFSMTWLAPGP
jgi:hypothetical protein